MQNEIHYVTKWVFQFCLVLVSGMGIEAEWFVSGFEAVKTTAVSSSACSESTIRVQRVVMV